MDKSTANAGSSEPQYPAMPGKWLSIGLLALCEVMALTMWFSASAIIPVLKLEFTFSDRHDSLLASSVAVGFVCGTLVSAILGLPDRIAPCRLFMLAAVIAAAANGAILLVEPTSWGIIALRLITGACMVGIYPVGMKMAATWAHKDTGLLVGLLVGALTIGTAFPHLLNAVGGVDWRFTLAATSVMALCSALLVKLGPALGMRSRFDPMAVFKAWSNKVLRLANFGYMGHMWELYAMWAWPAFSPAQRWPMMRPNSSPILPALPPSASAPPVVFSAACLLIGSGAQP
jgi:hypothetical protein